MAKLISHRVDRLGRSGRQERSGLRERTGNTPPARSHAVGTVNAAAQLISEAAHDLRSPLTAVRESVRLVHDGDLGVINPQQQTMLSDAIDQCECLEHLIGEMLTLDRLRGGPPRVHRRWISVADVRQSIDRTLRPWTLPRRISVVWNGVEDCRTRVFADLPSLRRLIINLAVNAVRVSPEGGRVMIEARLLGGGRAVRWSVVDHGAGISETQMREIAGRARTSSGGEGLGLLISRQLAALHFSNLHVRSRRGSGTTVSFTTPARDALAVASCWSRWRRDFVKVAPQRAEGQLAVIERGTAQVPPPRQPRANSASSISAELALDGARPRFDDQICIGTVSLGAAMPLEAADRFDELFQKQLTIFELAYRIQQRRWVWVFDADRKSVDKRIAKIASRVASEIPHLRIDWSRPAQICLRADSAGALLSDLLVRKSLLGATPAAVQQNDQVRLGTLPVTLSHQARQRLQREVDRLRQVAAKR